MTQPNFDRSHRPFIALIAGAVLSGILAGCAGLSESTTNALVAAPGRFDVYSCRDLVNQERTTRQRVQELEALMRRAEAGTAGTLISAVAYRSDHVRARAELQLVIETAERRKCDLAAPQADPRARTQTQSATSSEAGARQQQTGPRVQP